MDRKSIGQDAEQKACVYLQDQGLIVLKRNYYCYFGEIDIIMRDVDHIVFVEVRKRTCIDYGNAFESIIHSKKKKLIKTAKHFLQKKNWLYKVSSRFDVVAIHPVSGKEKLEWIKNAFSIEY